MQKAVGIILLCMCTFAFADDEVKVPSACEEDRAKRMNATQSILHLIPACEENGDYAALQCFTANDWCICYRRNGENINTPSKNIKACECVRARDDALTSDDDYVPKCTKQGYYRPKQCNNDGECWCVDKDGNVKSEPTIDRVLC